MAGNEETGRLTCVAGVLAGGSSRRMGRPKALLEHPGGGTLIEHVERTGSEVAQEVVVVASSRPLPASLVPLPVLPDAKPQAGPLAGLCDLLDSAADRWALLLACDMPYLSPRLLRNILSRTTTQVDAVAFSRGARAETYHTCCALYHPRILPTAINLLTKDKRSLQGLLARVRVDILHPGLEDARQLTNVNTPDDFARIFKSAMR